MCRIRFKNLVWKYYSVTLGMRFIGHCPSGVHYRSTTAMLSFKDNRVEMKEFA